MAKIVSIPIIIVDKPLYGEDGSPLAGKAEQTKREIQEALVLLSDSSNDLQIRVEDLEESTASVSASGLHPFTLMGA